MVNIYQQALDLIDMGDWDSAHRLIQHEHDELACLIHAYLHREEGDLANASYWYSQIGLPLPDNTLEEELAHLRQRISDSIL